MVAVVMSGTKTATGALGTDLRSVRFSEPDAQGFVRSWIQLLPEGKFEHPQYGDLTFTPRVLSEIIANFEAGVRGIELALDYDHRAPTAGDTRAPGWIERLALGEKINKASGLWAYVRWTRIGLADVRDQIYRYISAEYRPEYTDEMSGQTYHNVLIGATLTNRPYMKVMEAIQLAEVSTRAWGDVDKATLPDSAFLDPINRRLPIYEGAGPLDADGRYTQRGKLNIHGAQAALAAIHGARSGKPMTGLPSGIVARLEKLLEQHNGSSSDGGGDSGAGGARRMAGKSNSAKRAAEQQPQDDNRDDNANMYDDGMADEEYEDTEDGSDGSEDENDSFDAGSDTHGQMTTDGHAHGKFGRHSHDGEADHSDAPLKRSRQMSGKSGGKGSRKMSEGAEARTLAEANELLAEQSRQLAEVQRKLYEADIEKVLGGWDAGTFQFSETTAKTKNPDAKGAQSQTRSGRVALSKVAREKVRAYLLSDDVFLMETPAQQRLFAMIEAVASGAVDLSVRGSSYDEAGERRNRTDAPQNGRAPRGAMADVLLAEESERVAEEKGTSLDDLRRKLGTDPQASATLAEIQREAAARINYQGIR